MKTLLIYFLLTFSCLASDFAIVATESAWAATQKASKDASEADLKSCVTSCTKAYELTWSWQVKATKEKVGIAYFGGGAWVLRQKGNEKMLEEIAKVKTLTVAGGVYFVEPKDNKAWLQWMADRGFEEIPADESGIGSVEPK